MKLVVCLKCSGKFPFRTFCFGNVTRPTYLRLLSKIYLYQIRCWNRINYWVFKFQFFRKTGRVDEQRDWAHGPRIPHAAAGTAPCRFGSVRFLIVLIRFYVEVEFCLAGGPTSVQPGRTAAHHHKSVAAGSMKLGKPFNANSDLNRPPRHYIFSNYQEAPSKNLGRFFLFWPCHPFIPSPPQILFRPSSFLSCASNPNMRRGPRMPQRLTRCSRTSPRPTAATKTSPKTSQRTSIRLRALAHRPPDLVRFFNFESTCHSVFL